MRYRLFICCLLGLAFASASMAANRLSVADVWGAQGSTIELPVSMDNDHEVVAVQFTMTVPNGVSLDVSRVTKSIRMQDHAATVSRVATGRYMVSVMSATNSPFKGNSGELLTLYLNVGSSLNNGETALLALNDVVMSLRNGENIVEETVAGTLIVDNEAPKPILQTSDTDIHEGDIFQLTLTTAHPVRHATTFSLTGEHPMRFSLPATVTIPTGQSTASVTVKATDNDTPEQDISSSFIAYAEGYERVQTMVMLYDNDMPLLELELSPSQVKENDGPLCVSGTLRRTTNTDSRIMVRLSDDSNGGLYLGQTQIALAKGQQEAHFNLGPVDNGMVDGDRTYIVTAAVWLSSCNCSATGQAAGSVEAQLTVFDDDGPSLTLSTRQSALYEGTTATLTVWRNTSTAEPLTVSLTSNHDELLSYSPTVNIPAGQQSAMVEVAALPNATQGDTQAIQFTVQAEGYSPGTCLLMLTDQTLPDATIAAMEADKEEEVAGGTTTLTVTVANSGNAPLPDATPISIFRRGNSTPLATLYTQKTLLPGEEETFMRSITLPATTGRQAYYAVVNSDGRISELSTRNNTSGECIVNVMPPYTATLQTDKKTYQVGEKVVVSGQLEGRLTMLTDAELYVVGGGVRQSFAISTDEEGRFSYEWQPYDLEMGHFTMGVCCPGEGLTEAMTAIDIIGLWRQGSGYITCDVTEGVAYEGVVVLENPCSLRLTSVKAEVLSAPEGCQVQLNIPAAINGGETAQLRYTITGSVPTEQNDWEQIALQVTSAEGATLQQTLYYYCRSQRASLAASETSINTTMTMGGSHDYMLYITNHGRGSTGTISLDMPAWMRPVTGTTLPALAQNDTAVVVLHMQPTADMQLNVPQTGSFAINCQNGRGVSVDYHVTPVSDSKGLLTVDVCDEYTYYSADAPHVVGAEVVILNPITSTLAAQGTTDETGCFGISLPAGWYQLSVTANGHDSYKNNILVDAGVENRKVVNLSINGVNIDYNVEETEVEDEYEIVNTGTFETNVPVPVVVLEVPKRIPADSLQPGQSLIFHAKLTNQGLIGTDDVSLLLPTDFTDLSFEPLANCQGMHLAAGQSVTIPVKVTRLDVAGARPLRSSGTSYKISICSVQLKARYSWECGSDRKWYRYSRLMYVSTCHTVNYSEPSSNDEDDETDGATGSTPTPPNHPGGGGGYVSSSISTLFVVYTYTNKGCDPCSNSRLEAALRCAENYVGEAKETMKVIIDIITKQERRNKQEPGTTDQFEEIVNKVEGSLEYLVGQLEKAKLYEDQLDEDAKQTFSQLNHFIGGLQLVGKGYEAMGNVNHENLLEAYTSMTKYIDALFDEMLIEELGQNPSVLQKVKYRGVGKELLKWKKLVEQVMDCIEDFLEACDNLDGGTSTSHGSDYIEKYRQVLDYYFKMLQAYNRVSVIVWGPAPEWRDVSVLEMEILSLLDYSQPESRLMDYKPEALSVDTFRDFLLRRKSYIDHGLDQDTKEKLDSLTAVIDECASYLEGINLADYVTTEFPNVMEQLDGSSKAVCASIKLQFPQQLLLTRQAFRGTLTVYNGHEEKALSDMKLTLLVSNADENRIATQHEFQTNVEKLDGFEGENNLTSGWSLEPQQTGTATILFIPTRHAAPTSPTQWSFGGVVSYVDPFTGHEVQRELYPVTLTVRPTPWLDLDYFMQRDIYGDDPLTKDSVEQTIPAEFALIINNKGAGEARDVKMVTSQPTIVDNEKGLLITFDIVATQLNGKPQYMAMGDIITSDFGTIAAGEQSYAQWWLTSSLLGHFTNYDVTVNHLTSYGNPDLSLIDQTEVHELIHGFTPMTGGRGFLVNDIADAGDQPDRVYFTDATQAEVQMAQGTVSLQDNGYLLTMTPTQEGWSYGSVADPTQGTLAVAEVRRMSDGATVPSDNVWQTDRTLRDGREWLYENKLHFVASLPAEGDSYLLTFKTHEEVGISEVMASGSGGELQLRLTTHGDWLIISGEGSDEMMDVTLFDLRGMKRLQLRQVRGGQALNVARLPAGVYQVVIATADGWWRGKIMKR